LNLQASPLQFLFQHRNVLLEIGAVHGKPNYKKKEWPTQSIRLHFKVEMFYAAGLRRSQFRRAFV
jgi:hypothetical protein